MSKPSYRALHVALRIFSVLLAIGALFMAQWRPAGHF